MFGRVTLARRVSSEDPWNFLTVHTTFSPTGEKTKKENAHYSTALLNSHKSGDDLQGAPVYDIGH